MGLHHWWFWVVNVGHISLYMLYGVFGNSILTGLGGASAKIESGFAVELLQAPD